MSHCLEGLLISRTELIASSMHKPDRQFVSVVCHEGIQKLPFHEEHGFKVL